MFDHLVKFWEVGRPKNLQHLHFTCYIFSNCILWKVSKYTKTILTFIKYCALSFSLSLSISVCLSIYLSVCVWVLCVRTYVCKRRAEIAVMLSWYYRRENKEKETYNYKRVQTTTWNSHGKNRFDYKNYIVVFVDVIAEVILICDIEIYIVTNYNF